MSKKLAFVGIDPGKSGAITILLGDGTVRIFDMPVVFDGKKNKYDITTLIDLLAPCKDCKDCTEIIAVIEEVHAMPGQGVTSMFEMGYGLGVLHTVLVAHKIPFTRVAPQTWKKRYGLLKKEKDASRMRAIELFPSVQEELKRKKDDGRAESLLIADYCRSLYYETHGK